MRNPKFYQTSYVIPREVAWKKAKSLDVRRLVLNVRGSARAGPVAERLEQPRTHSGLVISDSHD
jgi:hypothetical protein